MHNTPPESDVRGYVVTVTVAVTVTALAEELVPKRLELLHEVVPNRMST
jgi:hypothetical protein